MTETSDRAASDRRLRFLRFGLLAITGVTFAFGAVTRFTLSGGDLGSALVRGLLWGVVVGVVSIIIYQVYKSAVLKA